jgi:secreted trypsin-like serine protease
MIRLLIVFVVASLGQADINRFVVGGQSSEISEAPYLAALLYNNGFICGVSIISESFILTAAHCFLMSNNSEDYGVRVGSSYSDKGGTILRVAKIMVHLEYNSLLKDCDFALLELKTPIKKFGSKTTIIPLASRDHKLMPGTPATIYGWGTLRENGDLPSILQKAVVPLLGLQDCRARFGGEDGGITERMLCADTRKKGPCEGIYKSR